MRRVLVLGGGGPVGIAWEAGLIAGLAQEGVDLAAAERIIGTSAGSFVGARLALGHRAADIAAAILHEADHPPPPAPGGSASRPPDLTFLFQKMQEAASGERDPKEVRREIGAFALAADTMDEAAFVAMFGHNFAGLPEDAWPERDFACTAVDAQTGEFVVWDKSSGVGVVRAVTSSCSVPGIYPAITIKGRRYIDGGMRSSTSADLAAGADLAVVVAVRGRDDDPRTQRLRERVNAELDGLKAGGTRVELIVPDADSIEAFGPNLMDFRRRPGAARAGMAQGKALAAKLRGVWG
ncbi:MAG TPA: patatin-like phospholipase family protein [Caulobacteraceae bacterium]|nr:patatin-like phospholipase family protein [Caulobacteraceae bacterium]